MTESYNYKILLIDDDLEMNDKISKLLSGLRIHHDKLNISFTIDTIPVRVVIDKPGFWKFSNDTINALRDASSNSYNLIMADYGLVDDEAKDILWGTDRLRKPTKEEAKGRILTLKDLSDQYCAEFGSRSPNIFIDSKYVFLRSFASNLAFDIAGPVNPVRANITKSAFPNAEVEAFDPRNEIYGGDTYYDFYDQENGREFYRQLISFHALEVAERYALRFLLSRARKIQIRRSIFNIALFAGFVAIIGGLSQYLGNLGITLITNNKISGWWVIAAGILTFIFGTFVLAFYFESFSKKVIQWVRTDHD